MQKKLLENGQKNMLVKYNKDQGEKNAKEWKAKYAK